ncbi:hypothetical protein FC07_GL000169 [Loigolactobacillus bifermentans DSM 20003]|uniref:WxL domain-containing protein n=1 Tax=Loigolactobacillus bifermentans DSM 20003 TaxID=1423726 RepID=A0A0R1GVR5_9LACO|nr:hypothetical protein FC07_GL000169 [Loigolactobacillus bifermentans DSM 20003]
MGASQVVHADDALPGFGQSAQVSPFNTDPNSYGGDSNTANTSQTTGFQSLLLKLRVNQSQVWSSGADVSFDHAWAMSFWTLLGKDNGSTHNDGMAFVIQPNSNTEKVSTSSAGETLGVYGDVTKGRGLFRSEDDYISGIANSAIQNSVAVEFDHYSNQDANWGSNSAFDQKVTNGPHIAMTYPASKTSYTVDGPRGSYFAYLNHNGVIALGSDATWHHVTIGYTPISSTKGTLSYWYDDRDATTNAPKTVNEVRNQALDLTQLGYSAGKKYYFGFTSYDKAGSAEENMNRIILDTYSDYVKTTASGQLTDHTQKDKTINSGDTVNGGDELDYAYTLKAVSGSKTLQKAMLKADLPAHVGWTKATLKTSSGTTSTVALADLKTSTGATLPDLKAGDDVTVTLTGTAEKVTTDTKVDAASYQFRNGGAENYLLANTALTSPTSFGTGTALEKQQQTPAFTITPGYNAKATVAVKDLNVKGQPDVATTKAYTGDTLQYDYTLTYGADSPQDWQDPTVDFNLPTNLDLANASGTMTTQDGQTTKLTADQIKNGYQIKGNMKTLQKVSFSLKVPSKQQSADVAIKTTTATFKTDAHSETADLPAYTLHGIPDKTNGNLTVLPEHTKIDATALTSIPVTGLVTDTNGDVDNRKNSAITLLIQVNNQPVQRIQMSDANTKGYFKFQLAANGISPSDLTSTEQNPVLDQALATGKNVVKIQALDESGNLSAPAQVVIGQLSLNVDPNLSFQDYQLTGRSVFVASQTGFSAAVTNTFNATWSLTLAGTNLTATNGKTLAGGLYYKSGTGTTALSAPVQIAASDTATQDSNGVTSVTEDWTHANLITDAASGQGVFAQVRSDATPATYHGTLTWTLVNAAQ